MSDIMTYVEPHGDTLYYDAHTRQQLRKMCLDNPSILVYNYGEDLFVLQEEVRELKEEIASMHEDAAGADI